MTFTSIVANERTQEQLPPQQAAATQVVPSEYTRSVQAVLSDQTAAELNEVIMVFKQAVLDEDPDIRAAAVTALGKLAAHDESILDILIERARTEVPPVRVAVMRALIPVVNPPDRVVDTLLKFLADDAITGQDRGMLLELFASGDLPQPVPRGIALLESGSDAERIQMAELLARYTYRARDAVPPLIQLAGSSESSAEVRIASLDAAASIMSSSASREVAMRAEERRLAPYVDSVLARHDANGDGRISRAEAGGAESSLSMTVGSEVYPFAPFAEIDTDGDGLASRAELTSRVLAFVGSPRSSRSSTTTTAAGLFGTRGGRGARERGGRGGGGTARRGRGGGF